jgi:4-hydroxy-tetrahydrodipicolinate synthase
VNLALLAAICDAQSITTRGLPMPRHKTYLPHGVIPAVLLPFDADLAIDEAGFRKHLRDVAATPGITAITINAHSTEVASCSFEEQRRVLAIAQDEIGGRLPLVNGIWADGSLEAARLARMAADGGASALLVFPPAPFTLGQSPAMALAHFKRIADSTDLPLIAFQYPLATGQGYPKDTLLRCARRCRPSAPSRTGSATCRITSGTCARCKACRGPVNVLTTHSAWLLPSLVLGCNGLLSGSGSVIPDLQAQLFQAVRGNDLAEAQRVNDRIEPLMRVFYADPFVDMHNRMKEALVLLGRLPRAYVRPPLVKIGRPEIARIAKRWSRPACSAKTPRATRLERGCPWLEFSPSGTTAPPRATTTSSAGTSASTCRSASACRAFASAGATRRCPAATGASSPSTRSRAPMSSPPRRTSSGWKLRRRGRWRR